jgi:hypothetical protein
MRAKGRVVQGNLAVVIPKISGIEIMRHRLAVVAIPSCKALLKRLAATAGPAQAPLAKPTGRIPLFLKKLRKRYGLIMNACPGCLPVISTQREGAQTALPE